MDQIKTSNIELHKLEKLVVSLIVKPLKYLYSKTKYWSEQEKLSWLLGFCIGDASIDRNHKTGKFNEVDLETSKLSTMLPFITMITYITNKPIVLKFYLRRNSFAKYKMRAFSHIPDKYMNTLSSKEISQINDALGISRLYEPFIAGFLDSDGSIQPRIRKRGKYKARLSFEPEVTFYEFDPNILAFIKNILEENFNIRGNIVFGHKGTFYRLRILSKTHTYTLLARIEPYVLNPERYPRLIISDKLLSSKLDLSTAITILLKLNINQKRLKQNTATLIRLMNKYNLAIYISKNRVEIRRTYYRGTKS